MKHLNIFVATVLLLTCSQWAHALTYDASVTTPPGVFFGSGNSNGSFVIDSENGLELALRAKVRGQNIFNEVSGTGTYNMASGLSSTNRALWNYEFSIGALGQNASLSNYNFVLSIDTDPGYGKNFTININPLTFWSDNYYTGNTFAQNSENLSFGDIFSLFPAGTTLDIFNHPATFDFVLSAYSPTGAETPLAQTMITVKVDGGAPVPEPSTFALFGLAIGLGGLVAARKRMTKS